MRNTSESVRSETTGCVTLKDVLTPPTDSFPDGSDSKAYSCNAGDLGLIPGLGRSLGEGNGYSLQYSCLENSINRGDWWATVLGVTKSWTRLSD